MVEGRRLPELAGPQVLVLVGMAGTLLPWLEDASGPRLGIGEGDGLLVVLLGAVSLLLLHLRVRAAWIAVGLGAAVGLRDLLRVTGTPGASVGIGLWLTTIALTVATVWLLVDLARQVRAR